MSKHYLSDYHFTDEQLLGKELILGDVILDDDELPDGFSPKVKGSLFINNIEFTKPGFNPIVSLGMDMPKVKSVHDDFHPVVGLSLCMDSLVSINSGFNPVVGSSLSLGSLAHIDCNFNIKIGLNLGLHFLKVIPDNFNPLVGNIVYAPLLDNHDQKAYKRGSYAYEAWLDNKYILANGVLYETIDIDGEVIKASTILDSDIWYLAVDSVDSNATVGVGRTKEVARSFLHWQLHEAQMKRP